MLTGLPGFLREGVLPLGAFYAGLRLSGLTAGVVAAALCSVLVYVYERRAGRNALLVRLSLGFVVVQSAIGLAADSATVYLAQPVLLAAAWGLAFFVSVAIGRPLAGELARAWYPFRTGCGRHPSSSASTASNRWSGARTSSRAAVSASPFSSRGASRASCS
jgi:hypothetical protein